MSDSSAAPVPSPQQIGELQRSVLRAVLSRSPLPGGREPVAFPDLQFVKGEGDTLVLDENFQGAAEGGEGGVRVVSREELAREAGARGPVGYLQFQPAAVQGGEVRLTLEAKLAAPNPGEKPQGLAGMQFVLRDEGGQWVGTPAAAIAM